MQTTFEMLQQKVKYYKFHRLTYTLKEAAKLAETRKKLTSELTQRHEQYEKAQNALKLAIDNIKPMASLSANTSLAPSLVTGTFPSFSFLLPSTSH